MRAARLAALGAATLMPITSHVCVLSGMVSASRPGGDAIQIGPGRCASVEEPISPEPRPREAPPRDGLTIGSR